jgi:hypothetical protein
MVHGFLALVFTITATPILTMGTVHTNDAGLKKGTVFTGSNRFQVQEIEVFEITD